MKLNLDDFELMLNTKKHYFNKEFLNYYDSVNLEYTVCNFNETQKILKQFINKIFYNELKVSGSHRKKDWQVGWQENLREISKQNFNPNNLIPKYINGQKPLRYNRQFIKQHSDLFEWKVSNLINFHIFNKYFNEFDNIYEFGCGSCGNIYELAKFFPDKNIIGLDWVESSIEILNFLKQKYFTNIKGYVFDFYKPNYDLQVPAKSAFFTHGALEQIGDNFNNFFDFIFEKKPDIVVNIECDNQFYNKEILIDYLSDKYHTKRKYLNNYISHLNSLAQKNKIKIIEEKRTFFGSQYHEVYNIIVFRLIK